MSNKVLRVVLIVVLVKNLIKVVIILSISDNYTSMIITQGVLPKHQETWVFPRFSVLLL